MTANTVNTVNQTVQPVIPSPYLKTLQDFYFQGGRLSRKWYVLNQDSTDKDLMGIANESASWANSTYEWIFKNITPAAAERFLQESPSLGDYHLNSGKFSPDAQNVYSRWYKLMPQLLANLDALMRSDEMYPEKKPQ